MPNEGYNPSPFLRSFDVNLAVNGMEDQMRANKLAWSWQVAAGGAVLIGCATAIALADVEIDAVSREESATCRSRAIRRSVDWTALFLGEFAVGGPPENMYSANSPTSCDCDECPDCRESRCPPQRAATDSGQVPDVTSDRLRLGGAAAEILKLRRAVGVNPIAGTIFDAPAQSGSPGDPHCAETLADTCGEQAIAEAIRHLEADQTAAASAAIEFEAWRGTADIDASAEGLLRSAERKLEEAAELLEQLGQYDRADVARDLAFQLRQQARECERQRRAANYSGLIIER
jgi:hypothetical protein